MPEVARELARTAADRLVQRKREEGHVDCEGGEYDAEAGVICGCGTMLDEVLPRGARADAAPSWVTGQVDESARPTVLTTPKVIGDTDGRVSRVEPMDPIVADVPVLDATQLYTPAMVEEQMLDLMARLQRGATFQRLCIEEQYAANHDLEMAYQRALFEARGEGAQDIRKAAATLAVEQQKLRASLAKLRVAAVEATMHNLRASLIGYASVAKSIGNTYNLSGRGGPAF